MATLHIPLLEPTFPLTAAPQCSGLQWSNVGPGAVETMLPGGGASGRGGRLGSALADRALAHRALSARSAGLLPPWPADAPVPMVIAGAGASWRRVAVEELAGRSQIAVQRPPHGVKKSPVFLDVVLDHIQCLSAIDLISLVDCRLPDLSSPLTAPAFAVILGPAQDPAQDRTWRTRTHQGRLSVPRSQRRDEVAPRVCAEKSLRRSSQTHFLNSIEYIYPIS